MLTMKRSGADRSTFLDRWETHVLLRDAAEIGRIEIHANEGHVTVQGSQFHCRIHPTARQRLTFIPARWVMYAGETELHAARPEGARTFLVDEVPGLGLLRLRPEGLLRAGYAIVGCLTKGGSVRPGFCVADSFPARGHPSISSRRSRSSP
jgi:hypothetical protein